MKRVAVKLRKICNDLRLLSSGPRCGLHEIDLPAMQPGSSIMPGKVNPVIPEVVNQVAFQIIGHDMTVTMAAEAGPARAQRHGAGHRLQPAQRAARCSATRASRSPAAASLGIKANREQCRHYVENSIGLVTALNPVLGYERSVAIATQALETGRSVYELVLEKGWLSKETLDDLLKPENMTRPR